jgi:hypothetical protein
MRSISDLARRAATLYGASTAEQGKYEIYVEEAWREFVHQVGGVYTRTTTLPLAIGQKTFAVPTRLREITKNGVYLHYTPRTIASIARSSGTVTVQTSTAHGLESGMTIAIDDVEPTGDTTFDGQFVVVTAADTTHFTYADDQDDDTGSGGEVVCAYAAKALTPINHPEDDNPATSTASGIPSQYYFPDAFTMVLTPTSDGQYPELFIVYDAEEGDDLDLSDALPVQAFVEPGIMAYAAGKAGNLEMALALAEFGKAVSDWRAARSLRENVNRYEENW